MPDPGWYERLGVRRVVNAAGRYTKFGGSVMSPSVVAAMADAARHHVSIEELHLRAGERLAELTRNEAAYVTTGAGAGIVLGVLAATTGTDAAAIRAVAEGRHRRREVIVQRAHHVPYIPAIRLAGAEVVEIGTVAGTDPADLTAAITEHTVAVLHIDGAHLARGSLDLTTVRAAVGDLPVIVDAAAQLPPVSNLWHFTRDLGADLALFSGGKDLCGPQASGLVVGHHSMIEAMRAHGSPNQRFARALKTGKEEIVGLVAAVEEYLAMDVPARERRWDEALTGWTDELAAAAEFTVTRDPLNEAGQPIPRLVVSWDGGPLASELVTEALAGEPSTAVVTVRERSIGITPETVADDEVGVVVPAIRAAWQRLAGVART